MNNADERTPDLARTSSVTPGDNQIDEILDSVYDVGYSQALTHASGGGDNTRTSDTIYKAKAAIEALVAQEVNKAEIRGRLHALDKMVLGAGEYHDDPTEYVVPLRHIQQYRQDLNKFDLTQPIYRDKAQLKDSGENA